MKKRSDYILKSPVTTFADEEPENDQVDPVNVGSLRRKLLSIEEADDDEEVVYVDDPETDVREGRSEKGDRRSELRSDKWEKRLDR